MLCAVAVGQISLSHSSIYSYCAIHITILCQWHYMYNFSLHVNCAQCLRCAKARDRKKIVFHPKDWQQSKRHSHSIAQRMMGEDGRWRAHRMEHIVRWSTYRIVFNHSKKLALSFKRCSFFPRLSTAFCSTFLEMCWWHFEIENEYHWASEWINLSK